MLGVWSVKCTRSALLYTLAFRLSAVSAKRIVDVVWRGCVISFYFVSRETDKKRQEKRGPHIIWLARDAGADVEGGGWGTTNRYMFIWQKFSPHVRAYFGFGQQRLSQRANQGRRAREGLGVAPSSPSPSRDLCSVLFWLQCQVFARRFRRRMQQSLSLRSVGGASHDGSGLAGLGTVLYGESTHAFKTKTALQELSALLCFALCVGVLSGDSWFHR